MSALSLDVREALEDIVTLVRHRTGQDFSRYKKQSIKCRIERRITLHKIESISTYLEFLKENPQEIDLLFDEMLIGVTSFFRDSAVWEFLRQEAIPAFLAANPAGKCLRAWVPACSTGEEAYSLAMIIHEALDEVEPSARFALQIFASDLNRDAIDKARQGWYPASIAVDVGSARLGRFFISENNGFRIGKEIRETVVFAQHNITTDAPFTKLDMLSCRDLLIYLDAGLQDMLVPLFHYSLNPGGLLVLGSAETVGKNGELFGPIDRKTRVYRRLDSTLPVSMDFPTKLRPPRSDELEQTLAVYGPGNLQLCAEQYLLQHLSPAAVLVNADGDILFVNGCADKYLEPAAGKTNLNIYAMARDGIRYELAGALNTVNRGKGRVMLEALQVVIGNDNVKIVNIVVQSCELAAPAQKMVMIAFYDVLPPLGKTGGNSSARGESDVIEQVRGKLEAVHDDTLAATDKMTSMNEELRSTSEELQSANEELITSKEEMQSMNVELQAVNNQLRSKLEGLSSFNRDMNHLLNSTDIATIFLDFALCIRRFTDKATNIFKLIPSDIGRSLSDVTNGLEYPDLHQDVREVLHTMVMLERQVGAIDGRWFTVRIMPFRTFENVIDGVVITFSDISAFKIIEAGTCVGGRHAILAG